HMDVAGNERADEEAKKAVQDGSSAKALLPPTFHGGFPRSKSAALQTYTAQLKAQVKEEWCQSPQYQRIHRYDPTLPSDAYLRIAD
ncbi:hypothetical protein B0H10DRAFT_1730498, partial [Mycena sp. CBHHK59/15]